MRRRSLLNPNSVTQPVSHLIAPWIAITTAQVRTEVLIITKSGIAVDLADFAMASYL
jgi:hypothetical protein